MPVGAVPPVRVWDLLVRAGHWSLVGGVAGAWITHEGNRTAHEAIGYFVFAVVLLRIVWGFAGPRRARFADFVRAPGDTIAYARAVAAGSEPRYLGHNPLGGWMIVAVLVDLLLVSLSGWLYTTDAYWGEEWLERTHDALAQGLLLLVAIHVSGVVVESLRHRENLVAAMFHGRKRPARGNDVG